MYSVRGVLSRNTPSFFELARHSPSIQPTTQTNNPWRLPGWLRASCGRDMRAVRLCHTTSQWRGNGCRGVAHFSWGVLEPLREAVGDRRGPEVWGVRCTAAHSSAATVLSAARLARAAASSPSSASTPARRTVGASRWTAPSTAPLPTPMSKKTSSVRRAAARSARARARGRSSTRRQP